MASKDDDNLALIQNNTNDETKSMPSYEDIVNETINAAYIWILAASSMTFWSSCSWYIWILYGRSLGESDQNIMAIVTYSCYFIQGISSLFWASLGDRYTYQKIYTLLLFMISVGYFIQFTANSFIQLAIGAIFVALSEGTWALSLAFIAKYLPLQQSIKYTSYQYAITTIFYIMGPIAGGMISYFTNYSWCFMMSCMISCIVFILFIIQNIQRREEKIRRKQIEFSNDNETRKFPICINKNTEINGINVGFWQSITSYNWFLLFCILSASASMYAIEAILAVYYTVFVTDLYPNHQHLIIIATLQIAVYCTGFIIGVRIVPKLLKQFKNEYNFNVEYGMLIILQTIMILVFSIGWKIVDLNGYWMLHIIGGFIMGIANMIQESILLSIQPNRYSGTIAGIKVFGRTTMKAIGCLLVGILWDINIYYWAYVQSGLYAIGLMCTLLMVIAGLCPLKRKYKKFVVSDVSDVELEETQ